MFGLIANFKKKKTINTRHVIRIIIPKHDEPNSKLLSHSWLMGLYRSMGIVIIVLLPHCMIMSFHGPSINLCRLSLVVTFHCWCSFLISSHQRVVVFPHNDVDGCRFTDCCRVNLCRFFYCNCLLFDVVVWAYGQFDFIQLSFWLSPFFQVVISFLMGTVVLKDCCRFISDFSVVKHFLRYYRFQFLFLF